MQVQGGLCEEQVCQEIIPKVSDCIRILGVQGRAGPRGGVGREGENRPVVSFH